MTMIRTFLFLVFLALGQASVSAADAQELPVFRVTTGTVDTAKAEAAFVDAFGKGIKGQGAGVGNFVWSARNGSFLVEIDRRSGALFLADESVFMNPEANTVAPDESVARRAADAFVRKQALLPTGQDIRVDFSGYSFSGVSMEEDGRRVEKKLDRHVNYRVAVQAGGQDYPVVGGGGEFKVVAGPGGRVVGFTGVWRPISGIAEMVKVKSSEEALADWRAVAGNAKLSNPRMYLAYYSAPGFERQEFLAPVWVLSAQIEANGRQMPLRIQIIPATDKYGPKLAMARPSTPKRPTGLPRNEAQPGGGDFIGQQLPPARGIPLPVQKKGLLDLLVPSAQAQVYETRVEADSQCATWWVTDGLPSVRANRQGFLDGCRAHGFSVTSDWGDANAWEEDWTIYDDTLEGVDAQDIVFYNGHADRFGWVLSPPRDGSVEPDDLGRDGMTDDRYGKNDLEHLIVAACGPHQHEGFVAGAEDAVARWQRIFNGLHSFQGYGAVTFDTDAEGRRFMELIRGGRSVIGAWMRTGIDAQPGTNSERAPDGPNIFVTGMYPRHRTVPGIGACNMSERLRVGGGGCSDVASQNVSVVFYYTGT
jgi:hypothetical protein